MMILINLEIKLMTYEALAKKLKSKQIRPSYQRIRILGLLLTRKDHPTADELYHALKVDIPALSKSTVYNTLIRFSEKSLVQSIRIDENVTRFDSNVEEHGHFLCCICNKIRDFDVNLDAMELNPIPDAKITERHVYFRGICRDCLNKTNPGLNKK
jgi:Fur family transcriptional regulator, peroxide stress response regulator